MLRDILKLTPDPQNMPVSTEMIGALRLTLSGGRRVNYDTDAALYDLALAILKLEMALTDHKAQIVNLEARILEAGLNLRPA